MLRSEIYHGYDANDRVVVDILIPNPNDSILEIGLGTGACAKRIAPIIKLYFGIDIACHTIEALKQHINEPNVLFYCFDMCSQVVPLELRERFRKIISFDTLEHVKCPQRFFKNLALMLAPNGEAIVGFPNESPSKMHGVTSFGTLGDILNLLEDASLKVVKVYRVIKFFLFKNLKQWLWEPITKVGKIIIAPRNYRAQCFDDTVAFRFITKPSKMGKIINIYARFLIKIASVRPIFHYIPIIEKGDLDILDRYILLHVRLRKY